MKKLVVLLMMIGGTVSISYAQRYMTRTGKVSFYSATPLEKIEAVNNQVASIVDAKSGEVIFQVPVKSFKFDRVLMEEHFNENYMESDKHPKSDFKGKLADIGNVNFSKDGSYKVTAAGKMTMHGVTKDVNIPGTIEVKGKTIVLNAVFKVIPGDYNIKIPNLVKDKIAKEMEVTVKTELNQQ